MQHSFQLMLYTRGGQLAARGPRVAHHSVFSGPWKHSEKITKSVISSNNLNRDLLLFLSTCFYTRLCIALETRATFLNVGREYF